MGKLDHFEIRFASLKPGKHEFNFDLDHSFFEHFENSLIESGKGFCKVSLDKKVNLLTLDFNIEIVVELTCDRSLKKFDHSLKIEKQLIIKFGEEEKDLGDDILVVTWDTQEINVAQSIYEFVSVAIPMKKIHPDYITEDEEEYGKIIYTSGDGDDKNDDPTWDALKNLN